MINDEDFKNTIEGTVSKSDAIKGKIPEQQ
jgi:hypothetical protein